MNNTDTWFSSTFDFFQLKLSGFELNFYKLFLGRRLEMNGIMTRDKCYNFFTMQNLLCFSLVFMSAALSARGGVPDSLKSYFFPAGAPAVANSGYPNSQHNDQDPDAASASGSGEERMSRLQSSIDEARRSYNAGDFSRYMTAKPVRKAQCYVEFQVTQRQPGRCIRLGGQTPACQTSDYVSINFSECS
ncbi:hypothetical protein AVEN_87213-1 [Araneus ventricosus]|uniref:Spaetzle domain-containing protein n=1 Tax=Araneus ventricosus TaxID=182803 RepID=A0A4Y2RP43_ARAVE|nr:hypothetical protein AVEN_87213-1 [Araneus ventricosus]